MRACVCVFGFLYIYIYIYIAIKANRCDINTHDFEFGQSGQSRRSASGVRLAPPGGLLERFR